MIEPQGRVVVLGDMHVAGRLTSTSPGIAHSAGTPTALQDRVEALTAVVEELLGRVADLEEAAAVAAPTP